MKKGWQTKMLEECIEKVTYTSKIKRKDFLGDGAYPIVSQEDAFINGYWDNEADLFKVTTPIVVFGDHTKVLKYVNFDFVLGADGVKVLKPRNFLLPKFFFYQLQTANLDSLGYARHYKLLKELEIIYPDRPEQQRIVRILDEAFEGIATAKANAEKNLQNARGLFESRLQFVFTQRGEGWVERQLGDKSLLEIIDGDRGVNYPKATDFYDEGHCLFLNTKNVRPDGFDFDSTMFISADKDSKLRKQFAFLVRYGMESPSKMPRILRPDCMPFMLRLTSVLGRGTPSIPHSPVGAKASTAWRNTAGIPVHSRE